MRIDSHVIEFRTIDNQNCSKSIVLLSLFFSFYILILISNIGTYSLNNHMVSCYALHCIKYILNYDMTVVQLMNNSKQIFICFNSFNGFNGPFCQMISFKSSFFVCQFLKYLCYNCLWSQCNSILHLHFDFRFIFVNCSMKRLTCVHSLTF